MRNKRKWFKNETFAQKCERLGLSPEQISDYLARPEAEREELLALAWAQEKDRRYDLRFSVPGPIATPTLSQIDVVLGLISSSPLDSGTGEALPPEEREHDLSWPEAGSPNRPLLAEPKVQPSREALDKARAEADAATRAFIEAGRSIAVGEYDGMTEAERLDALEAERWELELLGLVPPGGPGRRCIGELPMTGTERSRRSRERAKAKARFVQSTTSGAADVTRVGKRGRTLGKMAPGGEGNETTKAKAR
jgi:hypothetical protein